MKTLPRFIQISTLTTYPASLLNRDDSGLSKRVPFGGSSRTRISSQCLKRHWRMADDLWSLKNVDPQIAISVRSRKIFPELVERPLIAEGLDAVKVAAASLALQSILYGEKGTEAISKSKKPKKKDEAQADLLLDDDQVTGGDRSELIVLGHPEIQYITQVVRNTVLQSSDAVDADRNAKTWFKEHRKEFQALKCGAGLDAAMFGRFISGDTDARVSAAVHVAHAFTVHAEESETDYFSVADDLDPNHGSAHINATELTTGIFYGYVAIDVPLLVSNIEGCAQSDWQEADRSVAGRLVKHLLHLIATVTPGAKLGSTAPYARPWLILTEAGDAQPRTLADAFYSPVPLNKGDARMKALSQLAQYITRSDEMYGQNGSRWVASMYDQQIPSAEVLSLDAMGDALEKIVVDAVL